jgi:hypothetical protein
MNINEIIRKRFPNERTQDLANELGMTYSQVANRAFTMGLRKSQEFKQSELSGRANLIKGGKAFQYKPGHIPANKGKKMSPEVYDKVKVSMFKKGNRPNNWKPDGSVVERIDSTGRKYLHYKVKDSHWILYHHKIWTDVNGPIPKGCILRFKDGDSFNCVLDNLELISMVDNMNKNTIQRFPQEIQEVIKLKSKLKRKINGKKQNQ